MASNSFGRKFRITTFGESHGIGIGVVIDGAPPQIAIDLDEVQHELDRRKPGQSRVTTSRGEDDIVQVWSGLHEGRTTGAPIMMIIMNSGQKPEAYDALADVFRPGHADFTYWKKYGIRDARGGARASGRETASRVAAGAVAKQILRARGIRLTGHVVQIGAVRASAFDPAEIERNIVRCADPDAAVKMIEAIETVKREGDSLGAVVEVIAEGVPTGVGDPIYEKLSARLAFALMSIGAVKGVEIGDGFTSAVRRGSENNDALSPKGFATNHAGGILGGISTGAPIVVRIAVKPTSSIAVEQDTIDTRGNPRKIRIEGRHDPCIGPRIVPVAEAMTALVLADYLV